MTFLLVGFITFLLSISFVWITGILAYRYGWVAIPAQNRWHRRPVALHGGIAIFLAFVCGVVLLHLVTRVYSIPVPILAFFGGSILICAFGFLDDYLNLKPSTKLIGQIVVISLPIVAGIIFSATPWALVNLIFTYLWFIGIINAINLIDNMDWLASGGVLIATTTLLLIWWMNRTAIAYELVAGVTMVFLFAVAGFWIFNRPPASIFMGDSGSLFLGYMLAGLTIVSTRNGLLTQPSALFSVLLPATVLSVPIFDTILVTIHRKLHGRPASFGGKDHSSHRLVGLGFSEGISVLILYGLAIAGGAIAVALNAWPVYSLPLLIGYVLMLLFWGLYLGKVKIYPESDTAPSKARWTPVVTQFLHKRHVAEVFLDVVLIAFTYYLAYYLRFEGALQTHGQDALYIQSLPVIISSGLFGFYLSGIYRGIWHFITIADIGRYAKGVIVGVSIGVFLVAVLYRFDGYSRALFFIFGALLFLVMVGSRLSFRILDDSIKRRVGTGARRNIVIYGAGQGGKFLYEECMRNPAYGDYRIIGFVDDGSGKQGLNIMGLDIYEPREFVSQMVEKERPIQELWVSSRKIPHDQVAALRGALEHHARASITVRLFKIGFEELVDPARDPIHP